MKIITLVLLASTACAFQMASPAPRSPATGLNVGAGVLGDYSNDESQSSYDKQISPHKQFQEQQEMAKRYQHYREQQEQRSSSHPLKWKDSIKEAVQTFKEFRELEAAGLLEEREAIAAAKRKAAANFADFAKNDQDHDESSAFPQEESMLMTTAARLGRTAARIFGGSLPENYRD